MFEMPFTAFRQYILLWDVSKAWALLRRSMLKNRRSTIMKKLFVKRGFALFLSLVLAAGLLPRFSGTYARADSTAFTLQVEDGVLTISGDGTDATAFRAALSQLNWSEITSLKVTAGTRFPVNCTALFSGKPFTYVDLSGADFSQTVDIIAMFVSCSNLETAILTNLDFSSVDEASQVFAGGCNALKTVDLTGSDFSAVRSLATMFSGCRSLTTVTGLSVSSSVLETAEKMFSECSVLSSVDLRNFSTNERTSLYGMFMSCSSLTDVRFSSAKTYKASALTAMFFNCSALRTLDLSRFDTSNVASMSNMFTGCTSLSSLNISSFTTPLVTDFSNMFDSCRRLSKLDCSKFINEPGSDVSFRYMFRNCDSLTELDIRGLDITGCKKGETDGMFSYSSHIGKLTLGAGFPAVTEAMRLPHPVYGWVNSNAPGTVVSTPSDSFDPMTLLSNSGVNTYLSGGGYGKITGTQLTLLEDGSFGLRFYATLSPNMDPEDLEKGDVWFFFYPQNCSSIQVRAEKDSAGNYYASCNLPAKNMATSIQAEMNFYSRRVRDLDPGEVAPTDYWVKELDEVTYSIRDYACDILDNPATYTKEQNLVKAMLCYGGAAQRFFGTNNNYNICADVGISYTGPALVHQEVFEKPSNLPGLSYYGSSLILESTTVQRHYFCLLSGDITDYAFTLNNVPVTPEACTGSNLYYFDTEGFSALNLFSPATIKVVCVNDSSKVLQYRYSATEYIREGLASGQLTGTAAALATALGHLAMEAAAYAVQ